MNYLLFSLDRSLILKSCKKFVEKIRNKKQSFLHKATCLDYILNLKSIKFQDKK